MSSSPESKSSNSLSNSSDSNFSKTQSNAGSTPPTSIATNSSPAKSIGSPILSADNPGLRLEWARAFNLGKCHARDPRKRPIQYTLFQNGKQDEDCDLPTKRFKTLQTTWNFTSTPSSAATIYLNERMLELSRITRRAIAARLRYQRLRSRELDLMKSILEDETELCQTQLGGVDVQIGFIRNMLQDAGVVAIGSTGSRFDSNEAGPWCESSSDEESVAIAASRGSSACPSDDSNV